MQKNEDHLIINQLNNLIQNTKSSNNQLKKTQIFSNVNPKLRSKHSGNKLTKREFSRLNSKEDLKRIDTKELNVSFKGTDIHKRKQLSHSPQPLEIINKKTTSQRFDEIKIKEFMDSPLKTEHR